MLLDINMPVMDGLTLLNELRERQLDVQAIIVSAYGDMTNLRTAMNRGAFDFVTKPVQADALKALSATFGIALDVPRAEQSFTLFFAEHCRGAGRPGRTARGGAPGNGRCAVCRYCRVHANG